MNRYPEIGRYQARFKRCWGCDMAGKITRRKVKANENLMLYEERKAEALQLSTMTEQPQNVKIGVVAPEEAG